uniref:Uncharacterized protein n=1 Tax=Pithovirus LCPAC403 TaxID=2506596 RepID=A0A481ZAJ1_9VIRU|nr:MAG: hypothetical protein LCPAC403_00620 [Pithovirus LCPAC403]
MNDGILLPIISILVVLSFLIWAVLAVHADQQLPGEDFTCPVRQCTVNRYNGIKTCSDEAITFDPLTEVCSDRTTCSNPVSPFAVREDGSTDQIGSPNISTCDDETECKCVSSLQCANYITSYFVIQNQDSSLSLGTSRTVFTQSNFYQVNLAGVSPSNTPPMILVDPVSNVCTINQNVLDTDKMYPKLCMTGTLAYLAEDSDLVEDVEILPLACVKGEECIEGITVYDKSLNEIVCLI